MVATARSVEHNAEEVLFVALELSEAKWKIGTTVSPGQKAREKTIDAGDLESLAKEIERAKKRFGLPESALVVSCYEAGRDGFWIHRHLESLGVRNVVVDPASIDVNRRKRRAKTDRLDVGKLLSNLMRWWSRERKVWSVAAVPTEEDEDARHFHREHETLKKERTAHINRIKGLLKLHGLTLKRIGKKFVKELGELRLWDGSGLRPQLRQRLEREYQRLEMVNEQLRVLARQRQEALRRSEDARLEKIRKLIGLRGIGELSAWPIVMELFGWRIFSNRRQIGSLVGLTGTPYDSGASSRELGIDKAGSGRLRALMTEVAWNWTRYQPRSALTVWFNERFANGGKRLRKIGIVAVARKLLIAIWRYLEQDIIPKGAIVEKA